MLWHYQIPFYLWVALKRADFEGRWFLKLLFKVTTVCADARLQSLSERQDSFVDRMLSQFIPDRLKYHFQHRLVHWLWCVNVVLLEHSTPDMIVQRVQIWRIRGPLVFPYEVPAVSFDPFLRQACGISWRAVLLKAELNVECQALTIFNQFNQQ